MTAVERLREVVKDLPEESAEQVLEFVERLLNGDDDLESYRAGVLALMSQRYADDEPEYTLADIKRR